MFTLFVIVRNINEALYGWKHWKEHVSLAQRQPKHDRRFEFSSWWCAALNVLIKCRYSISLLFLSLGSCIQNPLGDTWRLCNFHVHVYIVMHKFRIKVWADRKKLISIMVSLKPDWIGLVLSAWNQSCNPEFVQLASWYRSKDWFKQHYV